MSFWERIKEKLGGDGEQPSTAYHIVDVAGLTGNGGRVSPRERVALLQKLAHFAEREQLRLCAVMEGRPLREAPDGEDFKSIQVYYAESMEQLSDRVRQLVRANSGAMLVTHRRDLEEWAHQNGVATLRTSSLRRGLDEGTGGRSGGGDSGRSGGQRGRSRRPQRQRRTSSGGGSGGGDRSSAKNQPNEPKPQAPPKDPPRQDGVSDLIDLV